MYQTNCIMWDDTWCSKIKHRGPEQKKGLTRGPTPLVLTKTELQTPSTSLVPGPMRAQTDLS